MRLEIPVQLTLLQKALSALVALVFIGLALGYVAADKAGWVPHKQETTLYVGPAGWNSGDYRNCVALPQKNGAIFFLGCGAQTGDASEIRPVTYWGRVERPDRYRAILADPGSNDWRWRCRRKKSSITCWAVN